jgi:hypothetical protein
LLADFRSEASSSITLHGRHGGFVDGVAGF